MWIHPPVTVLNHAYLAFLFALPKQNPYFILQLAHFSLSFRLFSACNRVG